MIFRGHLRGVLCVFIIKFFDILFDKEIILFPRLDSMIYELLDKLSIWSHFVIRLITLSNKIKIECIVIAVSRYDRD